MARTVFLSEEKHSVAILQNLKLMKQENDLCDFTITVRGYQYRAHRIILSAGSPYFKVMLKHDTTESRSGKVEMKDVDPECVKSCIDYIYSGKFDIPDGNMRAFLHLAIMLQLEDVKNAICNILDEELNAENFYTTRNIAEVYQLPNLSPKCKKFYEENFLAISAQPDFVNEKKSHIVSILKSKKLKLSEEDKLTVSLRWVGTNHDKKECLSNLLKLIKLKEVPSKHLNDLLANNEVVSNDLHLYKLINAPLVDLAISNYRKKEMILLFDDDRDSLQSYDPATYCVTKHNSRGFEHLKYFTAIASGVYVYVLCGDKSVHRLGLQDKNSEWERMQDMIDHHGDCPPSVTLLGSLFIVGSSVEPSRCVEKFDPVINHWLRLNDKPAAVCNPTLVDLGDTIYSIGGFDGSRISGILCRFTPSSSEWVNMQPMKKPRSCCGAVAVEQRIFVIGGLSDNNPVNDAECYDVVADQWSVLSPTTRVHGFTVAHHVNGWIYSVACYQSLSTTEKYDIVNDHWHEVNFKDGDCFEVYDSVLVQI